MSEKKPGIEVREIAEKFFEEEINKLDDPQRKEEVELEKETYIGVWMLGYRAGEAKPKTGAVWVKASERLPEKDGYYCFKANGGYMGAYLRTGKTGNRWFCDSGGYTIRNWKQCEWLDESPAEQPVVDYYDTLYYIVLPALHKLRHRTDNDTRMLAMGSDIRNTIHNTIAEIKKLPQPKSANDPPYLVQSAAEQPVAEPVLPTFWDVAEAFKWAAEYSNEKGEQLVLSDGQWTLIAEDGDETETEDLTPGNVAELYCLQKGFEKAEQPGREFVKATDTVTITMRNMNVERDVIADLKAKGERLAIALSRLARSVTAHPDYGKGQPNEFFDLVDYAHVTLTEWSGEKEAKP